MEDSPSYLISKVMRSHHTPRNSLIRPHYQVREATSRTTARRIFREHFSRSHPAPFTGLSFRLRILHARRSTLKTAAVSNAVTSRQPRLSQLLPNPNMTSKWDTQITSKLREL